MAWTQSQEEKKLIQQRTVSRAHRRHAIATQRRADVAQERAREERVDLVQSAKLARHVAEEGVAPVFGLKVELVARLEEGKDGVELAAL